MKRHSGLVQALAAIVFTGGSLAHGQQVEVTRPEVSEQTCPVEVIEAPTRDGQKARALARKPPGKGPFPAVIFLHGGLSPRTLDALRKELELPTQARFLAAGYVIVNATFRSRREDPQTRDALLDCLAIIESVKKLPTVDPRSVVVMGGSGGGSLALELAGEADLCAVAAGEPASVLFTGMMTEGENPRLLQRMMDEPRKFYTPELQTLTREKIRRIHCPVFIGHGDKHPINKINHEIVIPELKEAGKELEVVHYPGQPHGFYFGRSGSPEAGKKFFDDCHAFFKSHLPTQPTPLDESLIKQVPVGRE